MQRDHQRYFGRLQKPGPGAFGRGRIVRGLERSVRSQASKRERSESGDGSCRRNIQIGAFVRSCWRWVSHLLIILRGDSDRFRNSYQNAIGSARKVLRLIKQLDLDTSRRDFRELIDTE